MCARKGARLYEISWPETSHGPLPCYYRFFKPQASFPSTNMDINAVRDLVADDMAAVDRLIRTWLRTDVALIDQLGHYVISSGGKRLRPTLALLSAKAQGYQGDLHAIIAAIVEFIHTATLLHDDVVDASSLRRGKVTANLVWGNEASVLVGDFLYSRSFQMMVEVRNMRVLETLADATNTIAEGEVLQLVNCHDPSTTEARYFEVIHNKTAKLFEAACRLGAILNDSDEVIENAMAAYGRHLGTAYQLIDDVLDYSASPSELGKNVGDDLAEGKPTLPLLYALWNGNDQQTAAIREAIEKGGHQHLTMVMQAIESTGAIAYTAEAAKNESESALAAIAEIEASPYKDALETLARYAIDRRS